jgi:hypothetical protein
MRFVITLTMQKDADGARPGYEGLNGKIGAKDHGEMRSRRGAEGGRKK